MVKLNKIYTRTGDAGETGLGNGERRLKSDLRVETYGTVEEWTPKQLLAFEKEALGFYISGHPLDRYRADLSRYADAGTTDFAEGRRGAGPAVRDGV